MTTHRAPARAPDVVQKDDAVRRSAGSESLLLTVEEAAVVLAVPTSWLKQRVAARTIACTRLGRHIRFTREQVAAIVAASEQPAAIVPLTGLTRRSRRPA